MERLSTTDVLSQALRNNDVTSSYIAPDADDVCWLNGSETFTRKEVAHLLWTQIAMISNELKKHCGKDLTADMFEILNFPRIPQF